MSGILSINTNISASKAQRQLARSADDLASTQTRLSSGLRINTAADDAAGLAVSSLLKADTRIYSQGLRNLNDGISLLNIADGSISSLSDITIRLQELAEQSASGTLGFKQRKSLDAEAQALAEEYFRIARTSDFNGLKLFDGTIQGLSLQAGYGNSGSIISSLGGVMGTGTFNASASYINQGMYCNGVALADLNSDGILDLATSGFSGPGVAIIRLGNGDGTFKAARSYTADSDSSYAVALGDLNGDGFMDLVTAGGGTQGYASIRLGNGNGTFGTRVSYTTDVEISRALALADLNSDGVLDIITAGGSAGAGQATIRLGNGDGTFKNSLSYAAEASLTMAVSVADLNDDGILDLVTAGQGGGVGKSTVRLGNGDGTFKTAVSFNTDGSGSNAVALADANGDGIVDLLTGGYNGTAGSAAILLGNGDGTFKSRLAYQTETGTSKAVSVADVDSDGLMDLVTAGKDGAQGWTSIRLGNGDGTFNSSFSFQTASVSNDALAIGDVNDDGVFDIVTAGAYSGQGCVVVNIAGTEDGIAPIQPFSLKTRSAALQAIPMLKDTLDRLSTQRGIIGAYQSRLASAISTLRSTVLEYTGAQSRVEDADIPADAAKLVRDQILQQAATSVLAQANQAPALALVLLK